mgnify:CR=1 FL=1
MRSHEQRTICTCSNATVMSVYHPAAAPSSAAQARTHPARVPARGIPDRACALLRCDPRARQSQGSATQTRVTAWRVVWARVGVLFGVPSCLVATACARHSPEQSFQRCAETHGRAIHVSTGRAVCGRRCGFGGVPRILCAADWLHVASYLE